MYLSQISINLKTNLSNLTSKVDKLVVINQFLFITHIVKKDAYNAKFIEGKIPDITNLATNTTLNAKK